MELWCVRAGLWIFFTQNFDSAPLSFGVVGNLGADSSGHVNALTLNSPPWKGFVKSTCEVGAAANPEAGTADTRDPYAPIPTFEQPVCFNWIEWRWCCWRR